MNQNAMRFVIKAILSSSLLILSSCVNEHHAVVSTAAIAETPWSCDEGQTEVVEISEAKYRLTGCGETAVYDCPGVGADRARQTRRALRLSCAKGIG
jgi:hypothetical protein